MTIRKQLETILKQDNLILGNYDKAISKLTQAQQTKLIKWFHHTSTIMLDATTFVEIQRVDKEVDIKVLSGDEYISLYGQYAYEDAIELGHQEVTR